jgi:hypothetical protein
MCRPEPKRELKKGTRIGYKRGGPLELAEQVNGHETIL